MSDYFKNVLLADESEIYLTYALISLTGPTLGVVVGITNNHLIFIFIDFPLMSFIRRYCGIKDWWI